MFEPNSISNTIVEYGIPRSQQQPSERNGLSQNFFRQNIKTTTTSLVSTTRNTTGKKLRAASNLPSENRNFNQFKMNRTTIFSPLITTTPSSTTKNNSFDEISAIQNIIIDSDSIQSPSEYKNYMDNVIN